MKIERIFYLTMIAVLGILLLWNWKCSGRCPVITETQTVTHDTVWKDKKDSAETYMPTPIAIHKNKKIDPVTNEPIYLISEDSARIISDYFDQKFYAKTFDFDSSTILVKTTVSENAIQYQQVLTKWKIPEKTTTVTNTVTVTQTKEIEKRRTQLYAGFGVIGNQQTPFNGLEGSLLFKTKKDFMFEAAAIKMNDFPLQYKAGIKIKIHF